MGTDKTPFLSTPTPFPVPSPTTTRPSTSVMDNTRAGAADVADAADVAEVPDATLQEAVNEMNRYSTRLIVVTGAGEGARLRVSGVFRTGDNAGFARAVGRLHGLRVVDAGGRITLGGGPEVRLGRAAMSATSEAR